MGLYPGLYPQLCLPILTQFLPREIRLHRPNRHNENGPGFRGGDNGRLPPIGMGSGERRPKKEHGAENEFGLGMPALHKPPTAQQKRPSAPRRIQSFKITFLESAWRRVSIFRFNIPGRG
jgi:hypothetical protein